MAGCGAMGPVVVWCRCKCYEGATFFRCLFTMCEEEQCCSASTCFRLTASEPDSCTTTLANLCTKRYTSWYWPVRCWEWTAKWILCEPGNTRTTSACFPFWTLWLSSPAIAIKFEQKIGALVVPCEGSFAMMSRSDLKIETTLVSTSKSNTPYDICDNPLFAGASGSSLRLAPVNIVLLTVALFRKYTKSGRNSQDKRCLLQINVDIYIYTVATSMQPLFLRCDAWRHACWYITRSLDVAL